MTREHRASRWLRRSQRQTRTATAEPPSESQTQSTYPQRQELETPPRSTNLMPPGTEPPPPYSPSADGPFFSGSGPVVLPAQTEPPPPVYELPPAPHLPETPAAIPSRPPHSIAVTLIVERHRLADVFSKDPWRRGWAPQPIHFADALNKTALFGLDKLLFAIMDAGATVKPNKYSATQTTTPIHEALRGPKPGLALALLDRQVRAGMHVQDFLESRDAAGCTPLHVAAGAGETDIVRSLILFYGAPLDTLDKAGRTPLHMAARYGRLETVETLLYYGADPSIINQKLWRRVGDDADSLLGSYALISEMLRDAEDRTMAVFDREENEAGPEDDSDSASDSEASANSDAEDDHPRRRTRHRRGKGPAGALRLRWQSQNRHKAETQQMLFTGMQNPGIVLVDRDHPYLRYLETESDRTAMRLASTYGLNEVATAHRVLQRQAVASSSTPRRPAPSMLHTPEYEIWKKGCQTVQAESKAQKKKNLKETGCALDVY